MHVCHVITRLIVGGAQENTLLTCEGLHRRGHRVTLISGPTRGPEGSLAERARGGGYEFIELPELVRAVNPWYDLRARRELTSILSRLAPDLVHTHSSKAGVVGRFAARDARVPQVVHTIHGMSFNRTQSLPVRWAYRALERRAARCTHALVGVSEAMVAQAVRAGIAPASRFRTVYSGMRVREFTPGRHDRAAQRAVWGISDQQIVVGTIARLFRRKGYEQLIPIMHAAAQREPRLRFVWVGDGAQRAEYEAELHRLRLPDGTALAERTHLAGLVSPDRIPELIEGMDILAHTSQWEGLPRVAVQALLMRVPVVAFDIDGTPEVVLERRTGRCVRLNDAENFALALLELAADADLRRRYGAAGRDLCLERFDCERMVDQLESLYEEITQARKGRHSRGRA